MQAVHELDLRCEKGDDRTDRGVGTSHPVSAVKRIPTGIGSSSGAPTAGNASDRPRGIRSVLYFELRLDYLAGRQVGKCQNCGGHFPILKRGARACSEILG